MYSWNWWPCPKDDWRGNMHGTTHADKAWLHKVCFPRKSGTYSLRHIWTSVDFWYSYLFIREGEIRKFHQMEIIILRGYQQLPMWQFLSHILALSGVVLHHNGSLINVFEIHWPERLEIRVSKQFNFLSYFQSTSSCQQPIGRMQMKCWDSVCLHFCLYLLYLKMLLDLITKILFI